MDRYIWKVVGIMGVWGIICILMAVIPIFVPDGTDLFFRVLVSLTIWMSFVLGLMHGVWMLEDYHKYITKLGSK